MSLLFTLCTFLENEAHFVSCILSTTSLGLSSLLCLREYYLTRESPRTAWESLVIWNFITGGRFDDKTKYPILASNWLCCQITWNDELINNIFSAWRHYVMKNKCNVILIFFHWYYANSKIFFNNEVHVHKSWGPVSRKHYSMALSYFYKFTIIEACEACDTCSFTKSVYLCSLTAFTHEIEATYWNLITT